MQPAVEGRMVPVLILDTRSRPEIEELIRVHRHLPPGDVRVIWGELGKLIVLRLKFIRPLEVTIVVPFDVGKQRFLADSAMRAMAVYLQAGKPGDRLRDDPERPKVLVELPTTEFEEIWERLFVAGVTRSVVAKTSLSHRDAREVAIETIRRMREVTDIQLQ
jgi:hypothetical protein